MVSFTGLGSLPGTDFPGSLRMTLDAVPELPYLPELPQRGPWAGMIGRGLGLGSGLPAELVAGEWRLCGAAGIDQRRARATWRDDLDRLEEIAVGYHGRFKVATAGPWTLAAALGLNHTGRVLADHGARRDLADSLAESIAELLADLQRRLPEASLLLQLDEPSLAAVAAGAVPTPGGFFRHRAVDLPELLHGLAVITAAAAPATETVLLHSCAAWAGPGSWPLGALAAQAGFSGFSLDLDTLSGADLDALGEVADGGVELFLGVLPTGGPALSIDQLTRRSLTAIERLGQPKSDRLVLTPACGLAGWSRDQVKAGLAALRATAANVAEELGS